MSPPIPTTHPHSPSPQPIPTTHPHNPSPPLVSQLFLSRKKIIKKVAGSVQNVQNICSFAKRNQNEHQKIHITGLPEQAGSAEPAGSAAGIPVSVRSALSKPVWKARKLREENRIEQINISWAGPEGSAFFINRGNRETSSSRKKFIPDYPKPKTK